MGNTSTGDSGKNRKIPPEAVKVPLPKVEQQKGYSCGAAALRSVCEFYGVGPANEQDYVDAVGADPDQGTPPAAIVAAARDFGLRAETWEGMSFNDLKGLLDLRRPVICCLQAWGSRKDYRDLASGHYVVAIGYEGGDIYFEDPNLSDQRGYLTEAEFGRRWRDHDDRKRYDHFGIVVWKAGRKAKKSPPDIGWAKWIK